MFYTLIQEADRNGVWQSERFVSIQADSQREANERAEWFGIDFEEIMDSRYRAKRWTWYLSSCGTIRPEIARVALHEARGQNIHGDWIIVYKDGNLRSSLAIPLENEPDPYAVEVVDTSSPYIFSSYIPYMSAPY